MKKRRKIIIGDVHGCVDQLERLLKDVNRTPDDHVIMLGDLVDRGPDSAACIDVAIRIQLEQGSPSAIIGNHEEKHLMYEHNRREPTHPEHIRTRSQLKRHHYDFIRSMPTYVSLPENNVVCVHAGVWPNRPMHEQRMTHLLHAQMINPSGDTEKSYWPSKVPQHQTGWEFWTKHWKGPERVVFGHTVMTEPLITDKAVGLDLGACFGERLCALVIDPDDVEHIVTIDCSELKGGHTRVSRHHIEGNVYCYG